MSKTTKWFVLALLLSFISNSMTAQAPKREFRSAWIATVANIDWPKTKGNSASAIASQKSQLLEYLDKMEEMNLTTICFQVRSMCDAMYKSSYEPWASYLTGTRGKNPGWDPLEFCVEECHKRGIEVYAWVNPYRWASSGSLDTWNTDFDKQVKENDWLITNGTFTVLNPGLTETRAHIVKVCKEIISNYSVEGLIFDDYFYPSGGTTENSSAPDYDLWKNSGTSLSIADWRRENVDKMVTDVYNMVQEVRPEVRFGIAPPGTAGASASKYGLSIWPNGYDTQYSSLYSDPLSWMNKHILDFVSPQIYWHNDHKVASFGKIANWWYGLASHFGNCHCNISVNVYDLESPMSNQEDLGNTQEHWDEHITLIKQSRTFAADNGVDAFGTNFYSIQYLCGTYDDHGTYLRDNCFQTKSLVPVVDWKKTPTYGAVNNLTNNNGTLSWTAVTDGLSTIRYTVYAIPTSIAREDAETSDGFDVQYLQAITYDASYTLPSDKKSGYWYAVCVYDGYGKEHTASIAGYTEKENAPKATLISPENNAELEENITFSWKNTDSNVTAYTLQVSPSATFSTIKYSKDVTNSSSSAISVEVSASAIGKGTFYWRVISKGNIYLDTPSDSRKFTISKVGVGEYEEGYSIMTDNSTYEDVNQMHIESLWMRSVSNDFENMTFENSGSFNRSMVATDDYVYISGRTANSSSATAYLDKYDGLTGEYIGRLTLDKSASITYYPCNNVIKDSNGNICISNLTLINSGPIIIHKVDLESGALTQVASLSSTKQPKGRFDHVSILGDVTTGNFTVFGVAANTANVVRWKFVNGSYTESMTTISAFYPTSVSDFGIAPRIQAITDDDIFIDGGNTAMTRYTFSTGSRSGSFLANTAVAPTSFFNNGFTFFSLGEKTIMVYAYNDFNTSPANNFNVVTTTNELTYSDMSQLWTAPQNGLGNIDSSTWQAVADHVKEDEGKARLYLYVPGNGLCAYEISDMTVSGIEDIKTYKSSEHAEYYNLQGIKVNGDNLTPGLYIKRQGNKSSKILIK